MNAMSTSDHSELEQLGRRGRWLVVSTVARSGAGHVGGSLSAMELLLALYFLARISADR